MATEITHGDKREMDRYRIKRDQRRDVVTQIVYDFEFPNRVQFDRHTAMAQQEPTPPYLRDASWLMYASSFGNLNYSGEHAATHYFDAATNPSYRHDDSGFTLTYPEMVPSFVHDFGEDIGPLVASRPIDSLASAYLMVSIADKLLGDSVDFDLENALALLTNQGDLVFDPVNQHFSSGDYSQRKADITIDEFLGQLWKMYDDYWISPDEIDKMYDRLAERLEGTIKAVDSPDHNYLLPSEREYIRDTVKGFIVRIKDLRDTDTSLDLSARVNHEVQNVSEILSGPLEDARAVLLAKSESPTLLSVKKTLYQRYIRQIMDHVEQGAERSQAEGVEDDDSYLGLGVIKLADARDIVTRWGPRMKNRRSIFRKDRILLRESASTVRQLRSQGMPYKRLERAHNFLLESLEGAVEFEKSTLRARYRENSQYLSDYDQLRQMDELLHGEEFRERIRTKPRRKRASLLGFNI